MENSIEGNGRLDRLRRGLYSRKGRDILDPGRTTLEEKPLEAKQTWVGSEGDKFDYMAAKIAHSASKHHPFAKKFFFFSLAVFVIATLVVGFMFFGGMNLISSQNVDIQISGPVSVGGGQEASFDISIINKNSADLEGVKLTIEYPLGVRVNKNLDQDAQSDVFELGNIKSGAEVSQNIHVFIFGSKDEVKTFKLNTDYKVKNSNASFFKSKNFDVSISSSPLIINSIYPKEINSNQDIDFSVEVVSNSSEAPRNFLLNVDYPFGFTFKTASPAPDFGSDTWKINALKPGDKKTIKISGNMVGQDNEVRVFKVVAGSPSADDAREIGVPFLSSNEQLTIKKPFIGLNLSLGGSSGDPVVNSSNAVSANVTLRNNITEKLFNATIKTYLSGPAFSDSSVTTSQGGFFRSQDNSVFWDGRAVSTLKELNPGQSVDVSFSFGSLGFGSVPQGFTPTINVKVVAEGDRILSSGMTDHVSSTIEKTVKLSTDLALSQRVYRTQGGISNSGSVPPKVNQPTTYAIKWSISNSFNNATNVVVKAVLPPYVDFTGVRVPENEKVSFDPNTKEVIWTAGQVLAGTGFSTAPKEVSFQVSFLPSLSQVGYAPTLINEASISGFDKAVSASVSSSASAVTTKFSSDPAFKEGYEKVVN